MVLDQFLKCWNGLGVYKWIYTRVCTKQYVKTSSNDCFLIRRKRNIDNAINNFLSEIYYENTTTFDKNGKKILPPQCNWDSEFFLVQ